MYDNSRQKDFFWGALVGGTVAALTSLLFTTQKGKQIQRKIADTYEDIEENLSEKFSNAKDKVKEGAEDLHKKASEKLGDAKDKLQEGSEHLQKKASDKLKEDDHRKDVK